MSLFKSRIWWELNLNENDSYDSQCLLPLTLDDDIFQSILLGSHGGYLRLFAPSIKIIEGSPTPGYQASHLLLERKLSAPILQIDEGILVSGSDKKQVAILHSNLFSVYTLKKVTSTETNVGDQVTTELVYQHVLRHSARSFVLGSFGRVRGRHFISIWSLDGLVSFYEQESFAFQVYLPDFLFSFGFTYLEKIDSFIFLNGFLNFDCYSYEALASAAKEKKIIKTWEYRIGEAVIDVQTVLKGVLLIIVLSERNLWALNENGCLLFEKRLEYTPVALCSYLTEEDKKVMILVATDAESINLYEETQLKWSMKISQRPASLKRVFLKGLAGGLVLLSEDGILQCIYVGTHPSVYLTSPLVEPEINFKKAETELKEIQKKIKNNELKSSFLEDRIDVDVKINKSYDNQKPDKCCSVLIEINVGSFVDTLQVLVHVEWPLVSTNPNEIFTNFSGKAFVESKIRLEGNGFPSSVIARIIITSVSGGGVAMCLLKKEILPMGIVMGNFFPKKEAAHKLNITTNKPIVTMSNLFKDLVVDEGQVNAIAAKYRNSEDVVTVLAAKSTQKYRIQSDSLGAATILVLALVERLEHQFRKSGDFHISNGSPLPLDACFEALKTHHRFVAKRKYLEEMLLKECRQYRTIQKKILNELKNMAPKPSFNFHKLLVDTSKMVSSRVMQLEELRKESAVSRSCLTSLNRLLAVLLKLSRIRPENLELVEGIFDPPVRDADDQGWLEMQETTTSFLLRRVLTTFVKDEEKNQTEISEMPMENTTKLIKQLSAVIDRFLKGTRLSYIPSHYSDEIKDNKLFNAIPAGTEFVNLYEYSEVRADDLSIDCFQTEEEKKEGEKFNEPILNEERMIKRERSREEVKTIVDDERGEDENEEEEEEDAIWNVEIDENRL